MTYKRVQAAAARRGVYLYGGKRWINNVVGWGYCAYSPYGGLLQADTLEGFYRLIKDLPKQ